MYAVGSWPPYFGVAEAHGCSHALARRLAGCGHGQDLPARARPPSRHRDHDGDAPGWYRTQGPKSSYLHTTTGRRSGQTRTTPVVLVETEGQRWLVSPYGLVGWVHNVRALPEVSLRRGGTTEVLRAEEVGPEVAGPILRRYVRNARVTAPFFDAKADDPVERFVEEPPRHPVFKLSRRDPGGSQ